MKDASTPVLHLKQLYEISKLLTRFAGVEHALPRAAALLAEALPLRSVVVIFEDRSGTRSTIVWPAEAQGTDDARAALARGETSYAYLSGTAAMPAGRREEDAADGREFVALPLVVGHAAIFGALQLETIGPCSESDLLFANAVANQFAVALDRHLVIETRQRATDSKKEHAEARRDEADAMRTRYEALVDHLGHAFIWEADAATRQVSYVSARAEMLLGYSRARWLAEPDFWMTCVHSDDRSTVVEVFSKASVNEKDQRCDHRCLTADGRVVWVHTGVHLAHHGSDAPTLQGVSVDITPTKDAEAAKQEQLDFSRAVTRSLSEGVVTLDRQRRITFLNPAAERLLGVRQEETLGADVKAVLQFQRSAGVPLPDEERPAYIALRTGETARSEDYLLMRRQGGHFPVSCTAAPLRRGGLVEGAVIVFQDITERRGIEETRREADRRKDEFLAMLGHELRNPLAPIASAAHALKIADAAGRERAGDIIERQVERMGHLLDELLDIARVTTGRIELDRRQLDLRSVAESAIETARPRIDGRRHELEVTLPAEPLWVHADAARLVQVAANLLNNAAKYTAPGGRLAVIVQRDGEDGVLRVRDNGPGMTAELLPRVFELFSQGERTSERADGGLGIGLAVVRRIVELHGGKVEAKTVLGEGSELIVRLPLASYEPESTVGADVGKRPTPSARRLRILVVDDNVDTAESMAMLLRALNHDVRIAHDGTSAIESAVDFRPDMAFLDIGLPGMDGNAVAKHLRGQTALRDTVLVALTGYGQDADRQRSRAAGFDHHLTKPASYDNLERILNTQSPTA